MQELTLAVVGIDFPNADGSNRRSEAMMTLPGEPIELLPEPKNKHDANAIAVIGPRGVQLGYVECRTGALHREQVKPRRGCGRHFPGDRWRIGIHSGAVRRRGSADFAAPIR